MTANRSRQAVIIGAGPAGLTAAYELASRTDLRPIVLEKSEYLGGISRTVAYKGNRIDLGGHRFFSKSDRVMDWWLRIFPLDPAIDAAASIAYHGMRRSVSRTGGAPAAAPECVMLLRRRKSRIYYGRRFFEYPITLSLDTLRNLGMRRTLRIGASYARAALLPSRQEDNLEQFLINRFGRDLYRTFFESYTEKVWGVPCRQISAEWGAQRIKGVSIAATLAHALRKLVGRASRDIGQKGTETSLIEQFLYPKLGPGQLWEEVARRVRTLGGEIHTGLTACGLRTEGLRVLGVEAVSADGTRMSFDGEHVFSTAPVRELVHMFDRAPPENVLEVADGLVYRDFITVGLLLRSLRIQEETPQGPRPIEDNWIYVQEPEVRVGRLQIFNNWSPFMVADPGTVWIGCEYFCNQSDDLWNLADADLVALARRELAQIGIIEQAQVLDGTVLRMEKTYPAYFGTYPRFDEIRAHLDRFENLHLIGRNGMHRYNNQDHSMLTAMVAVDSIIAGRTDKAQLWAINTETDYHESEASAGSPR